METLKDNKLVIISGPSGSGKNSIMQGLLSSPDINCREAVSATTRVKRDGEIDGMDYHFVNKDKFEQLIKEEKFVEYFEYHDNYYGTLKDEISSRNGEIVVLVIEVNGAENIRKQIPSVKSIFVKVSLDALKERLKKRGMTDDDINERMEIAEKELKHAHLFDKHISNDGKLEDAVKEVIEYLKKTFPQSIK
jgi:guanylate kinase